jgi:predicted amidophosphoribosyltransferase
MERSLIIVDDVFTYGRVTRAARQLLTERGATNMVVACLALTR